MKKVKTKSKKYPLILKFDGHKIHVPKQSNFTNDFLRKHGCSLMAEYVALQFYGIYKYPIHLLKWHRKHTKGEVKAKVTVRGVSQGISRIGKGKCKGIYYPKVTEDRIKNALRNGYPVIMEQKDPIHSICLLPDHQNGKTDIYKVSYGNATKTTAGAMAKTATTNSTYRGMVIVKGV